MKKTLGKLTISLNDGKDTGKISDGYHTFDELYEHRFALYIALCRSLQKPKYYGEERNVMGDENIVWRSKKHSDGTMYEGWFLLGIGKKAGEQITYHLPLSKWDETDFADEYKKAPCKFDGHTPEDVIERLYLL